MGAATDAELREALAAGIRAHDEGRLDEAERQLERAIALEPRSVAAHAALGQVRMDRGQHDAALESFQAAVVLQPTARGWNNTGIALMALERREEAARAFQRAAEIDPRYALARFNLARLHAGTDAPLALTHAQAAVQADPSNADAWLLVSDLLRRRQDHANAMRAVNLAIERAPQRPATWTARAALLAEMDRTDEAKAEYADAWTRFPRDLRAALGTSLSLPRVYTSHAPIASRSSATRHSSAGSSTVPRPTSSRRALGAARAGASAWASSAITSTTALSGATSLPG